MNSNIVKFLCLGHHYTHCICCPGYELWWPIMLECYWLDAAKNETAYQVVSCSSSKFTFKATSSTTSNKLRQIIGWTLVCVSIHLECWLDKARAKIVTWAAVGVAHQQHFSYDSVLNFGSVNAIVVDLIRIQCALGVCEFSLHSNRIKCVSSNIPSEYIHKTSITTPFSLFEFTHMPFGLKTQLKHSNTSWTRHYVVFHLPTLTVMMFS